MTRPSDGHEKVKLEARVFEKLRTQWDGFKVDLVAPEILVLCFLTTHQSVGKSLPYLMVGVSLQRLE